MLLCGGARVEDEACCSPKRCLDDEASSRLRSDSPVSPLDPRLSSSSTLMMSREEEEDVSWLVRESRKTLALLEFAGHGTVDLAADAPEIREEEEFTCQRFLKGFQNNRSKSLKMMQSYILWRSNTDTVRKEDITESLKAEKVLLLKGRDRRGGPTVVIVGRNHDMYKTDVEETVKLLTYCLDKAMALMERTKGITMATVILDLEGIGWRNLDAQALKHVMLFFQNLYPERVRVAVFWKAPGIFGALWSIVKPFLSEATRSKILFARETADLAGEVKLCHLPKAYGGQAEDDTMVPMT
ncbi:CRAL-TRIO lipid binding domain-containing protein [Chloropicon primus]|uniref:CRAL-TRIO lipid binding domain-containing protein n=1 Tax=Chloropicon primus TaxID=1764295 RepID=A0A5B8MAW8_9CHLO|nr:CRAL-TRIO lipid binding domain-containing protein [Chloropicon primus]UPQ96733.1 CRAL-TRIO lipid binding domain-containing protein [Chloropicon primus]|eukprot:QDZ17513.1 CRAL-TRIO lipid binding domain-containing protein [Chloropicon primus]